MRAWCFAVVLAACSAPAATPSRVVQRAAPEPVPGLRLPDDVTPLRYDLRLTIDPAVEAFHGEVAIRVRTAGPLAAVWLGADELDVEAATIDGAPAAPAPHDPVLALRVPRALAAGEHTIAIRYIGHTRHDQEGLFRQTAGGLVYEYSQGESLLARRIAPCFDEPRWKTPWHVTLVVPKAQVALGNMPSVRDTDRGAMHEVELADTPPMPSYLLAVAVGPFDLVDAGEAGANHVPVRVAALAGEKDKVAVATLTAKVLDAVEAYVGSPLPWPKLDLVVVPHLFGAMENPGLITFDGEILVGDPKELAPHFVRTMAHELVHQWFGNSVTPAWWDDLWLSEAFASWLGDKVSAQLGMLDDAALALALDREHALEADAETDVRPLRRTVETYEDPDNAFDAIAYEKGRAVLATYEAFVGETRLRDALRGYLTAHANATVTTRDLVAALPDPSALAGYIDHPGAPVVDVTVTCDKLVLHARDHLSVPACARTDTLPRTCVLAGEHTEIALPTCPAWVWPNDGAGYYQVAWQGAHAQVPLAKLAPAERIALADDAAAAFARGELAPADALAELRRLAEAKDPYAQLGALAIARVIEPIVTTAQRDAWQSWLAARFADRLGPDVLSGGGKPVERELREALLAVISPAHLPPATLKRAHVLIAHVGVTPDLAMFADEHALAQAVAKPDRDLLEALLELPVTRSSTWQLVRQHLDDLPHDLWPDILDATAALCDGAADVEAAFVPRVHDIPSGQRRLAHAVAQIQRCAALRARTGNLPL
jgi:aminopeptidase N